MIEQPYFLTNSKWYKLTDDGYILTREGRRNKRVRESYEAFLSDVVKYP